MKDEEEKRIFPQGEPDLFISTPALLHDTCFPEPEREGRGKKSKARHPLRTGGRGRHSHLVNLRDNHKQLF